MCFFLALVGCGKKADESKPLNEVKAEAENIVTGIKTITGTAFVTFVALDKNGKPMHVPRLSLKTDEDRIKFEEGKLRMEKRLKNRQK